MAATNETTLPATRRTRKSTSGYSPTKSRDKENATLDVGASALLSAATANRKKLRSKSMGPGGLDALKSTSGNRRVSLAAPSRPPPRSILKPTMPILPDIPPLSARATATGTGKASVASAATAASTGTAASAAGVAGTPTGAADGTKVALRTEEEQQAAAREREERERAAREKEVKDHREARRKSLANRRVSFAAEATLHTFHEIEYVQDSTTSTEATSRRVSSSAAAAAAAAAVEEVEDFYLPPQQPLQPQHTDVSQRRSSMGLSASASALGFDNPATDESTMYDSDGSGDGIEEVEEEEEDGDNDMVSDEGGESDSDEGDGATMVTVDADEMTSASVMSAMSGMSGMSVRSASPIESTSDLEEALRLATQHAGVAAGQSRRQQPLADDEELIPAFVGWGKKAAAAPPVLAQPQLQLPSQPPSPSRTDEAEDTAMSMDMDMDMDGDDMQMTQAMGGIIQSAPLMRQDDGMSMDVTRVYGGIIRPQLAVETTDSVASSPMIMPDDTAAVGDVPMELTTALGGIQSMAALLPEPAPERDMESSLDNEDLEDMSMELTTAMGGLLGAASASALSLAAAHGQRRQSRVRQTARGSGEDDREDDGARGFGEDDREDDGARGFGEDDREDDGARGFGEDDREDDGGAMEMTVALGQILPGTLASASEEPTMTMEDATMGMDITTALGGILKPAVTAAVAAAPAASPAATPKSPQKSPGQSAYRGKNNLQRTPAREAAEAAKKAPSTPTQTSPTRPSPTRLSCARAAAQSPHGQASPKRQTRQKSPKRLASPAEKPTAARLPAKPAGAPLLGKSLSLFTQDPTTGATTPSVLLTPQGRLRQSAFVGAGPASPKVTEIFNRRSSLLDSAAEFVVGSPGSGQGRAPLVTFEEPTPASTVATRAAKSLEAMDDREATQNLKDMIQNLSPKKSMKNALRGRKSLHVGSAKGLLGKRPWELDNDNDDDDDGLGLELELGSSQDFVKRLKGSEPSEPSPVKSIRLQQPPSAMETIGRSSRSRRSPSVAEAVEEAAEVRAEVAMAAAAAAEDEQGMDEGEHIHLQDFLNMANIHFMELETTKRRPTEVGGGAGLGRGGQHGKGEGHAQGSNPEAEALVATVCKVPLLEMYQHACRELKNYIEEGRAIMREIEAETYEDSPPIFREYMTATPELRAQMDSQFKNIKMFARLQSKKQWYEWRTKLHQGLQEGLAKTLRDLEADAAVLGERRAAVDAVYPAMQAEYAALRAELARVEAFANELGGVGAGGGKRDALVEARQQKKRLRASIDAKTAAAAQLQAETRASQARVAAMKREREQCLRELEEAKRLREERRSWSLQEISSLKAQVDALEKTSGWAVTGAQGTTLSLAYRREIELVFDVAAFRADAQKNAQIDLWYIGHTRPRDAQPCTPEKAFLLQCIRDHIRGLCQATTRPARLLQLVRVSWDAAEQAARQIRHLQLTFPTAATKTSDSSMAVVFSVLLAPLRTKIEATLHLRSVGDAPGGGEGLHIAVAVEARVVYGEPFNAAKMSEFLATRIGSQVVVPARQATKAADKGARQPGEFWVDVVEELRGKLLARGRK